jgi:hypothetical protein
MYGLTSPRNCRNFSGQSGQFKVSVLSLNLCIFLIFEFLIYEIVLVKLSRFNKASIFKLNKNVESPKSSHFLQTFQKSKKDNNKHQKSLT